MGEPSDQISTGTGGFFVMVGARLFSQRKPLFICNPTAKTRTMMLSRIETIPRPNPVAAKPRELGDFMAMAPVAMAAIDSGNDNQAQQHAMKTEATPRTSEVVASPFPSDRARRGGGGV